MEDVKFNSSFEIQRPERPSGSRRKKPEVDFKSNINAALEKSGGKYVKFDDIDHTEGLLVGGVKKDGKHYFAVMDRDKNMKYVSPNEHFTIIKDIPASLYILDYVYKHDADYLYERAMSFVEHDRADMFSNCYIKHNKKSK
jgi:hypothetical protein